jgi:hypothetical protein
MLTEQNVDGCTDAGYEPIKHLQSTAKRNKQFCVHLLMLTEQNVSPNDCIDAGH